MRPTLIIAVGFAVLPIFSGPAWSQASRTFVSGRGADTNPCSLPAPCRTFQRAHDATTTGGEVAVLDTAGYGVLTIAKAISIVSPAGVEAGIAVPSGGIGITVKAGPNDKVSLRGLTLEGGGAGFRGIEFDSGGTLSVFDCFVRNFGGDGILVTPSTSSTVYVTNTVSSDNGITGINVFVNSAIIVGVYLDKVITNNNTYGVHANAPSTSPTMNVNIIDSTANNNSSYAYFVSGGELLLRNVFYYATLFNAAGSGSVHVASNGTVSLSHAAGGNVDCDTGGVAVTYSNNDIPGIFSCNIFTFPQR
jgi:hypothetical protein